MQVQQPMPWRPSGRNAIERLQIIYKISERCNLNCSYCYYYHAGDNTALTRPALVSQANARTLALWLAQGCRDLGIPKVQIAFHGGEPMLMRAAAFAELCATFVETLGAEVDLGFSIQSNGTLLTDGWLEALCRFHVHVGISIDGRQADHDRHRLDHRGRSRFAATEASIRRLIAASTDHPTVRPGTISVLHPAVDYAATYRYLRGLGVRSMHFLLPDRDADALLPPREARALGQGLLDIFTVWLAEDDPSIQVRFISETLGHFEIGGPPPQPRRRKSNQVLVARSDNSVAIDDSLIPALDWYRTVADFPISRFSLPQVLADPVFERLEQEARTLPRACQGCTWAGMCRGGDLENRYSRARGFDNASIYCDSYRRLYAGIADLLSANGYPAAELARRFPGHLPLTEAVA